jgi:tetratricopeptide (TPR) repeat protein
MKNQRRRNDPARAGKDVLHRQFQAAIRRSRDHGRSELFELKRDCSAEQLWSLFPGLVSDTLLAKAHGPSFPERIEQLFSVPAFSRPLSLNSEIVWAVARCVREAESLKGFLSLRNEVERCILVDAPDEGRAALESIRLKYGISLWLLQNEIAIASHWDSLDEARQLSRSYVEELPKANLLSFLLHFITRRIEASGIIGTLRNEVEELFSGHSATALTQYAIAKVFDVYDLRPMDMSALLFLDAQSSVIDHYESLVAVLQTAAADGVLGNPAVLSVIAPLRHLYKKVGDSRLIGLLRSVGDYIEPSPYNSDRHLAIEAYSAEKYTECIDTANRVLRIDPTDIPLLALRTKAYAHLGGELENSSSFHGQISSGLGQLYVGGTASYQAAFNLLTFSQRFYGQHWTAQLRAIVLSELSSEEVRFPSADLKRRYILDCDFTPFTLMTVPEKQRIAYSAGANVPEKFPATWPIVASALGVVLAENGFGPSEIRARRYRAKYLLAAGNADAAYADFTWLLERCSGIDRLRTASAAALCCLELGRPDEAARIAVAAYLDNPNIPGILPLVKLAEGLSDPDQWSDEICTPLLLELHRTFVTEHGLATLRYAFERFIERTESLDPTAFRMLEAKFGADKVVMFMDKVWRPEVMRQTLLYQNDREIEEARVLVCKVLAEIDPARKDVHLHEVKERVKKIEIAKGTSLIEKSKIHVDIEAIRRALHKKLSDSYARYKSSLLASGDKPAANVAAIAEVISENTKDIPLSRILSMVHLVDVPMDAADAQFAELYNEVTNEFLRGDHGLNAYLSTCVKHGTLSNTLRKPSEDENLVTSRDDKGAYVENEFWKPEDYAVAHQNWAAINAALASFSKEFDEAIAYLKDSLLQIRIVRGISDADESGKALFFYRISNFEQLFVQEVDKSSANMDEFVNRCVDLLWEKTDQNLVKVQGAIDTEIRQKLNEAFDRLEAAVRRHGHLDRLDDLIDAIVRARTSTQVKINTVISWFQRSKVFDRQDYAPEFPAQIALNMVKNTLSSAAKCNQISIKQGDAPPMPGRTLDSMVYVYYDLLANAVLRSKVPAEDLEISVDISFREGRYFVKVTNNINNSAISSDDRARVDVIRKEISEAKPSRRAQADKNSGLHKIWVAVNAPSYANAALDFHLSDTDFVAELQFSTVGVEHDKHPIH